MPNSRNFLKRLKIVLRNKTEQRKVISNGSHKSARKHQTQKESAGSECKIEEKIKGKVLKM
jgi:hypothetical protein